MDEKTRKTRLHLVKDDQAALEETRGQATPAKPKTALGKELTRFADQLDAQIAEIMRL